jgi:tetratricopeptide (TPR) repeat protein
MTTMAEVRSPRDARGLYTLEREAFDALYAVGHTLFQAEDYVRAADVFRFLLLAEPKRTSAWLALGACHEHLDEHDVAASLYEAGFRLDSQAIDLGLLAARARARSGEHAEAEQLLDDVARADGSRDTSIKIGQVRRISESDGRP